MRQLKGIAKEMKSRWLLGVARVKKEEGGWGGVGCAAALRPVLVGSKSRSRLSPELPLLVLVLGSWRTPVPQPHLLLPILLSRMSGQNSAGI